jgi:hypothetical protein
MMEKKDRTTNKNVISPTFGYKFLVNKFKNNVILFFYQGVELVDQIN